MPAGVGTVIRLDINQPIRTRRPMTYITPDLDIRALLRNHGGKTGEELKAAEAAKAKVTP